MTISTLYKIYKWRLAQWLANGDLANLSKVCKVAVRGQHNSTIHMQIVKGSLKVLLLGNKSTNHVGTICEWNPRIEWEPVQSHLPTSAPINDVLYVESEN